MKATKKRIPTELYLNGHYNGQICGVSNSWINQKLHLVEFLGHIDDEGIRHLSNRVKALHIKVDYTSITSLNTKLSNLKELTVLGMCVERLSRQIYANCSVNI